MNLAQHHIGRLVQPAHGGSAALALSESGISPLSLECLGRPSRAVVEVRHA